MPTLGITGKLERIRLYGCLKNPLSYNVIYLSSFSTFVPNVFISFKTNEIKSTTICSYWSSSKILKQHCLVGINYNLYFVFSEVIFVSSLVEFLLFYLSNWNSFIHLLLSLFLCPSLPPSHPPPYHQHHLPRRRNRYYHRHLPLLVSYHTRRTVLKVLAAQT